MGMGRLIGRSFWGFVCSDFLGVGGLGMGVGVLRCSSGTGWVE